MLGKTQLQNPEAWGLFLGLFMQCSQGSYLFGLIKLYGSCQFSSKSIVILFIPIEPPVRIELTFREYKSLVIAVILKGLKPRFIKENPGKNSVSQLSHIHQFWLIIAVERNVLCII